MKTLSLMAGYTVEWIFSILWMPVHYRNMLQAKATEAQARALAAQAQSRTSSAQELASSAQTMAVLWGMGTDYRPLARLIADRVHEYYGVEQSKASPGNLVPIRKDAHN